MKQISLAEIGQKPIPLVLLPRASRFLPPEPFDLHVLGTPPAFVLSQDQTLRNFYTKSSSQSSLYLFIIN